MAAPGALLVMGVSGSGKSTVGALLASKLGWKFYDADDYHPEENRMKMGKGIPLKDQDRIPWLCNLHDILLRDIASGQHVVLACSALKKAYRDVLIRGKQCAPLQCDETGKDKQPAELLPRQPGGLTRLGHLPSTSAAIRSRKRLSSRHNTATQSLGNHGQG
ncbi:probable gluconokinase isoform X2 [Zalophus californianus]|uniref:gluconokinase n=1 Tax=Zalophus californianus TaxID=9704 RepID=A0A6J2EV11_ZALCA|nr:probable gluconokinase isoform X2 [Zalophus californianus]